MSLPEVADELGMTRQRIYDLMAEGRLRGWRSSPGPRGQWRIDADSVQRFKARPPADYRDDHLPRLP